MLNNSSGFVINGGRFINNPQNNNYYGSRKRSGLKRLYQASIPDASYDSYARSYAPKCFPGTREQYIQDFTSWTSNFIARQDRRFPMTWMSGPAGVGKSALAQTFAETIGNGMLGAAFFFSRPNKRNNPDCFFPSIAYQISTKVKPLANILNEKIDEDPSLLSKTIEVQFQELIVAPLLELKSRDREMQDRLVIVDGLDECRSDDAQCTIVEAIATAIREHGDNLPLLWAFFSRPEPHIVRTFTSHRISPFCWSTTLPVSREIDDEIRLYLRGGFENIRRRRSHIIPPSKTPWPSEEDITALVVMSAGLFVYAATVLKFIGDPDALDAKERLKTILSLRSRNSSATRNGHSNPMEELDTLYTLIMQRIHRNVLPVTLSILLLCHELPSMPVVNPLNLANWGDNVPVLVNLLGVTFQSFDAALSKLHSVLKLDLEAPPALSRAQYEESAMVPWKIHFYHASFMEFLTDPTRCGSKFWIQHPNQYTLLAKQSTDFLNGALEARVLSPGSIISGIRLSAPLGHLEKDIGWKVREHVYRFAYAKVFDWHASANMDESLVDHLSCFNFRGYWALGALMGLSNDELGKFITKLPVECREQLFKPYKPHRPLSKRLKDLVSPKHPKKNPWVVLGQGEKSVILELRSNGSIGIPDDNSK